ncbi:MAG: sigma-70 family RNA polymerase sigma factor [Chitinophagales bacterium]|nr:sigma-70 family RNA polymerase sigma factor [Chitinophagales bacterium]
MGHQDDTKAFLKHINECEGILQKICRLYYDHPADREDLYQDILLNAWKSFASFRGDAKFSTWLYQVGINTAMSKLRKKPIVVIPDEPTEKALEMDEERGRDNADDLVLLYKALHQLSGTDKTIALLYLDELSYREIAVITGLAEANVGMRISRVKEKLKKLLLKYGIS